MRERERESKRLCVCERERESKRLCVWCLCPQRVYISVTSMKANTSSTLGASVAAAIVSVKQDGLQVQLRLAEEPPGPSSQFTAAGDGETDDPRPCLSSRDPADPLAGFPQGAEDW